MLNWTNLHKVKNMFIMFGLRFKNSLNSTSLPRRVCFHPSVCVQLCAKASGGISTKLGWMMGKGSRKDLFSFVNLHKGSWNYYVFIVFYHLHNRKILIRKFRHMQTVRTYNVGDLKAL